MTKFMKNSSILCLVLMISLMATACGSSKDTSTQTSDVPAQKVDLTISAAASLTNALQDIQKAYESTYPNIKLNFNFAASGALQQQIEQGAPVDLFISAAKKNLQALVDKQLIQEDKSMNLLTNELVVVVPTEGKVVISHVSDLSHEDVTKVAVGIPESVPAGNYAKEALTKSNLWDTLQSKIVQAKDVRQVLQYVETGNVDAGFVYQTDALTSDKVKVIVTVDPTTYTTIEYPMGIVSATKHLEETEAFYAFLQSEVALNIFIKYGFSVPK
ncbi:molybdate ABC transporter substrate-binding protein [Paenibacillus antarcticus]|uniref:Molybdate ABC transporter substrate-binding protein n=1 Tax=Paenibacillus antarcticus TaxID=253703 RepID=A0A162MDV8_9BACL|nr:molybdate ABC transporter substrate-binding protein [Paenibacillus antarcticus]OAB47615.1 molybdate ABC transporter substrate-binding protein [Paenibacillus antarcticus]